MARRQRVAIVGKTHMGNGICIGGLLDASGQPVRLLPVGHPCHPGSTPFDVGELWEMDLRRRWPVTPPHVEDHEEWDANFIEEIEDVGAYIRERIDPTEGTPSRLFGGRICFRDSGTGTAFIDTRRPLPANSVEFWELPADLRIDPYNGKARYKMFGRTKFLVSYVGVAEAIPVIWAGTLVRVSLARPWTKANDPAEHTRCSVQLSGWFGVEAGERGNDGGAGASDDDIPF